MQTLALLQVVSYTRMKFILQLYYKSQKNARLKLSLAMYPYCYFVSAISDSKSSNAGGLTLATSLSCNR